MMVEQREDKMKEKTTEKYDELWNGVQALDSTSTRLLLCYLMGYCKSDEHFLAGVESRLAEYSREKGGS